MAEPVKLTKLAGFFPKQSLALEATKTYKYFLYGGTKGSGKSRFLRWAGIYWLTKWASRGIPQPRAGLFCEDYPSLKDRHIGKIATEFPPWLGTYYPDHSEHGRCYILSPRFGSGILAFRNLDDVSKYESSEFAAVLVDELQKNSLNVFTTLRTRMRWPGITYTKFIGAAIPGGEPYVAQYWIDRQFPNEEKEKDQFYFLQALPGDNSYLAVDYQENVLGSLTPQEQEAYARGNFHAFDEVRDPDGYMKLLSNYDIQNASMNVLSHYGPKVLGVDPGAGGDETAMVQRSSLMAEILFNEKLADTMQCIPLITKLHAENQYTLIAIDPIGVGKGVYDRLVELGFTNVRAVSFGAPPTSGKWDKKLAGKPGFKNLKAELFWKTQRWLAAPTKGRLYSDPAWNQLASVKYKSSSDLIWQIMSKEDMRKNGYPSPNVADALAMTFIEDDDILAAQQEAHQTEDLWGNDMTKTDGFGFVDSGSADGLIPTHL